MGGAGHVSSSLSYKGPPGRQAKETWPGRHAKHPGVFGASNFGKSSNHNSNSPRILLDLCEQNPPPHLSWQLRFYWMGSHLASWLLPGEFSTGFRCHGFFPVIPLSSANFSNLFWWVQQLRPGTCQTSADPLDSRWQAGQDDKWMATQRVLKRNRQQRHAVETQNALLIVSGSNISWNMSSSDLSVICARLNMLRLALELWGVPWGSSRSSGSDTCTSMVLSLAPTICSFAFNRLRLPESLTATCLLRMPKSSSEDWEQMKGIANSKKVALMTWEYTCRSTSGRSERGDDSSW